MTAASDPRAAALVASDVRRQSALLAWSDVHRFGRDGHLDCDSNGPTDVLEWLERHRFCLTALDAYSCEGGMATGLARAGFCVFAVDLFKHKNAKGQTVGFSQQRNPFPSHQGDAVQFITQHGHRFHYRHAAPPCQPDTAGLRAERARGTFRPSLIDATRRALQLAPRLPYSIENVEGAKARLHEPTTICGCMFNMTAVDTDGITLHLQRPRLFESNFRLDAPRPCDHSDHEWVGGSYGGARRDKYEAKYVRKGGYVPSKEIQQQLLGIDWMTEGGMYQCVPPIYGEWVGLAARAAILRQKVAA